MEQTWWKWGDPKESVSLEDFPKLKAFLEEKWQTELTGDFKAPDYLPFVPESKFTADDFKDTFPDLKPEQFSNTREDRLKHTFGKSYHDLMRIFTGTSVKSPDFVLYPESVEDLKHILHQASERKINIATFSGGSSVTGALEVENGEGRLTAMIHMRKMDKLLGIDKKSHTATFQTGIFGPELEKQLNQEGFTLGHFPQSFEYSTLGGWLATRSAGQESGKYGKIEDMVLGMKVATPTGIIENTDYPKHASGIDTYPLFIGSEGTLGVIAEAKMRIHKKPEEYQWITAIFKDFDEGLNGVRSILQAGLHPGIVRLSDEVETQFMSKVSNTEKKGLAKFIQNLMKSYLKSKGFTAPCLLMMRQPIENESDRASVKAIKKILKQNKAQLLPAATSSTWEENRFSLPYLRDPMIEHRILIDTFETVTYWDNAAKLYHHIFQVLENKSDYFKKGGMLFCHLSHVYETGTSLYFTLLAPQEKGNEIDQWLKIKQIVTDAVVEQGGAVSHHHGIGKDHRKWYLEQLSEGERQLLQAIKRHLDPNDILNPGKLFDEKTR